MNRRNKALWAVAALLTLNIALVGAQLAGAALPKGIAAYFLGPKMVRAEVVVMEGGGLHDYRLDRGMIRAKAPGSLTLREKDGTLVTLPIAPDATITLNSNRSGSFAQLHRGMQVLVIREGENPAIEVRANGQ